MKNLFKQPVALVLVVSSLWQSCYNPSDWRGSSSSAPEGQTSPEALDKPNAEVTATWHGGSPSLPEQPRQCIPFKVSISEGKYADKNKKRHYEDENIISNSSNKGRSYEDEGKSLNIQEDKQAPAPAPLTEPFDITGTNNQSYRVYPFITPGQAKDIENSTGIVLKTENDKISGFLGGGAFGRVYVAEQVSTHQFYAVKIIQGDTQKLMENVHEADIHQQLMQGGFDPSTSHFMPLVDAIQVYEGEKLTKLYYILPLAALGNVKTLREQLNTLDNKELKRLLTWHIANGLLLGLRQMHKQQIYHLDVKLENLLVNAQGRVLVSDFGTSEQIKGKRPWLEPQRDEHGRWIGEGDATYFPPERTHEGPGFDCSQADIYAAGASLWELVTGERFPGDTQEALAHATFQNIAPNSLANLVKHLLVEETQARWSLEQALNHPIFQKPDIHDQETMAVVLDFLKRFVQQVQLQARDEKVNLSLSELSPAQAASIASALAGKLKKIQYPFINRPDIQEQLKLYLPLQGSLVREATDPQKECFPMAEKVNEFLRSDKAVLVLLADGGSGKSLFMQRLTTQLLHNPHVHSNKKPWLPLYISLGGIQYPEKLLQEGLGLKDEDLSTLAEQYNLLLLADGFDEQSRWINLYVQNQLYHYNMKVIITSRINALPSHYLPYFIPHVPGEQIARGYQEMYVQPFNTQQIDSYIRNYVANHQSRLQAEVKANRLGKEWLIVDTYQSQVKSIPGLKELIRTPLLCRLSLEALPELAKEPDQRSFSKVARSQVYEAFMTRWIGQQQSKQVQPPTLEQVFALGQRTALSLYQENRSVQVNCGIATFQFKPELGCYQQQAHSLDWFIQAKAERDCLPIQEVQKGQYKLMHFSMQEYLLARHLYQQLVDCQETVIARPRSGRGNPDTALDWNLLKLTTEEKDRPILYFLADFAETDTGFKGRLFALIEQSKADKGRGRAAANAITVLNAAHENLCSRDFAGIAIPDADLSGGVLWGTNFQGADLTHVNLKGTNSREVDLSWAQLNQVRLGQLPSLKLEGEVYCCVYSPDGRHLAITAGNGIIIYDILTRRKIRTLEGHSREVKCISYHPNGLYLASGSNDRSIKIWEISTGKCLQTRGVGGCVRSISYSPNGLQLVSSWKGENDDYCLQLMHEGTSKRRATMLKGHSGEITSVSYSPDGLYLASGSYDGTVKLWNTDTGRCLQTIDNHTPYLYGFNISYSSDGLCLALGSNNTVKIYDVRTGKCLQTMVGHSGDITSVSYSPDGLHLASGSADGVIKIWDGSTGRCLQTMVGHGIYIVSDGAAVTSVSYSHDGLKLASGSLDRTIRLWEIGVGECLQTPVIGHLREITSMSLGYSSNGLQLASLDRDGTIKLWDVGTGKCLQTLWRSKEDNRISYDSPNELQIESGDNVSIEILDFGTGKCLHKLKTENIYYGRGGVSCSSSDGLHFAVGGGSSYGSDYAVEESSTSTGKRQRLIGHTNYVTSVSYSPDGLYLASGSKDNTVRFWDVGTGQCLLVLDMPCSVQSVDWKNDGSTEKLVVGFGKGVAVFSIHQVDKKLEAYMEWANIGEQVLDFTKANFTGAQGLTSEQWTLMRQLGAVGEPAKVREDEEDVKTEGGQLKEEQVTSEIREESAPNQEREKQFSVGAVAKKWLKKGRSLFKKGETGLPTEEESS